jgi:molybdopterin-containing oxidoreductase family iron-sulfur binding subunit
MSISRRRFLGAAGLSALALVGKSHADVLGGGSRRDAPAQATPGTRLAVVIDQKKCLEKEGCDACVTACHRSHNVPRLTERAHDVKWIWKQRFEDAFPEEAAAYVNETLKGKPVLLLCNHCDNPPCVRVCPTQATWKREDGIVMMDWHRCIGCRYCVAACPYGSRSFNWVDPRPYIAELNPGFPTRTKGVVEKCNLCEERLAEGKLPLCVEACPEQALAFGNLNDPGSEVRRLLRSGFAIQRKPELGTRPEVYYIV